MMAFGDLFQLPQHKTGAQQALMAQQMGGPGATPKMGMATVKEGDEFLTYVTMDGVAVGQPLFRADRYKDAGVTVNTGDTPAPHPGDPTFVGYSDAGKGEYYIHDPNTGKLAIRTIPKEHRPTEGEAQRVVSMELAGQYLNNLKEARKRLQSKGTDISGIEGYLHAARQSKNPILQGMNEFAEKMGYPLDKDVAIAFTNANALRVDLLKAMRGVQVGPKEETMFETYVPTFGTPGATLDAVMGRLEMSLPYLTKRYDALRQLGVTDPSKATEAQKMEAARMAEPLRPAGYDSPLDTIDPYGAGTPPASPVPPPSGGADVSKWSVRTR